MQDDCSQAVTTVLDKCLYGENVVISNVLESDAEGIFPAKPENDVVIRQFVSSHEAVSPYKIVLAEHVRIVGNQETKFGMSVYLFNCLFYIP